MHITYTNITNINDRKSDFNKSKIISFIKFIYNQQIFDFYRRKIINFFKYMTLIKKNQ